MENMAALYIEMKDALTYFGLKFADMHLVEVKLSEDRITFTYNDRCLTVAVAK